MCNIVTFRFTCAHTLRCRRSRCGGTKHKVTATSVKAACVAESFLTIYLRIECNACQHAAWDDAWNLRLRRANTFLEKLRQRNMPGVDEVDKLVKGLEAEFATASWNSRQMFAHGAKPSISRVKHTYYERAASKLPQEVRPEDVVERNEKEWGEMNEDDYDGNYEASTDPVHPVSTDYLHPWDDDDGSWILQHLEGEDGEGDGEGDGVSEGLDFHAASWDWGDNTESQGNEAQVETCEPDDTNIEKRPPTNDKCRDEDTPTTTGHDTRVPVNVKLSPSNTSINHLHDEEEEEDQASRIQQVIQTFWSVVNANLNPQQTTHLPPTPPPTPTSDSTYLSTLLRDLSIDTSTSDHISSPPTTPTTPPQWLDGPSDSPLSSPSPPSLCPPTPPSPESTRSSYNKQRKILRQRRENDVNKYYADWLHISRCEIRDFEGSEGRMSGEPVKMSGRMREEVR